MAGRHEDADVELEQKLKSAIWYSVGKICEEVCGEKDMDASKQFIAVLAETAYRHAGTMAQDLEAFAKHAKRSTVLCDDVKLYVRKTPKLHSYLDDVERSYIDEKKKHKTSKNAKTKAKAAENKHVDE